MKTNRLIQIIAYLAIFILLAIFGLLKLNNKALSSDFIAFTLILVGISISILAIYKIFKTQARYKNLYNSISFGLGLLIIYIAIQHLPAIQSLSNPLLNQIIAVIFFLTAIDVVVGLVIK